MKMIVVFVIFAALFITGCSTTAGPFVTKITSDGKGNLTIHRAKAQFNSWTGELSTIEPSEKTIQVLSEEKEK